MVLVDDGAVTNLVAEPFHADIAGQQPLFRQCVTVAQLHTVVDVGVCDVFRPIWPDLGRGNSVVVIVELAALPDRLHRRDEIPAAAFPGQQDRKLRRRTVVAPEQVSVCFPLEVHGPAPVAHERAGLERPFALPETAQLRWVAAAEPACPDMADGTQNPAAVADPAETEVAVADEQPIVRKGRISEAGQVRVRPNRVAGIDELGFGYDDRHAERVVVEIVFTDPVEDAGAGSRGRYRGHYASQGQRSHASAANWSADRVH